MTTTSSGRHWPSRSSEGYGGPVWTEAEIEYLREHYEKAPAKDVAEAMGRSVAAIRVRAGKLGLKSHHRAGINSLVPGYFKTIDTPLKAYLLGLLAADGCISRRNQLALALSAKDASAVELLRDNLAPDARTGTYLTREGNPMVTFKVQSAELAADLALHGIVPAKTLVTQWPLQLPEHLEPSFVCGVFDGDGSIGCYKGILKWAVVSGSPRFLVKMQERILEQTGIGVGGLYRDTRHKAAWSICATGKPVRALDAWIHQDVPGLARKRLPEDVRFV